MATKPVSIRLSKEEVLYLQGATFLPDHVAQIVKSAAESGAGGSAFIVTDEDTEGLRDALTARLAEVGFDDAYNLTAEGRLIEELVDRFLIK